MNALFQIGLTNALLAAALAIMAALVGKTLRRPALSHALWLLVLIKLITPPLVVVPIEWPQSAEPPPSAEVEAAPVLVAEAPIVPTPDQEQVLPPVVAESNQSLPDGAQPSAPVVPAKSPSVPSPEDPIRLAPQGEPLEKIKEIAWPVPFDLPARTENAILIEEESPQWTLADLPWAAGATTLWMGGSLLWFAVALVRIRRFQVELRHSEPAPGWLQAEASELAARMGLTDCPGVWMVPGVLSPLLWAIYGYPRLLVPAGLLQRLDDVQRRTLLAHELAHYARRDHWVRCLEFAALGIYWWFPVAWWARRELREAEEECCDAWVIWTLPQAAKAYASALVETLDFLSGPRSALPPAASGLGQLDLLRRRLTMIMRGTMPRKLGGVGLLAVLGLAALLLPMAPGLAQQQPKQPFPPGTPAVPPVPPMPVAGVIAQGQPAKDVNKARAELERAAAELEVMKAQLALMQQQLEMRMQEFKHAQERVKQTEKAAKGEQKIKIEQKKGEPKDVIIDKTPLHIQMELQNLKDKMIVLSTTGQHAEMEKRIASIERKLDEVLQEVRALRKGAGSPPAPGAKGGAGGGKGGGAGGAGGGKGGGAGGAGGGAGGQGGGFGGGGGANVGGFTFVQPPPISGQSGGAIFNLPHDQQFKALSDAVGEDLARYIMMIRQEKGPQPPAAIKK